ncbi:hypothetical protein [Sphingomonas sanxanigenens]|uniref:hypothetical protein n=1 Tax=Sphingomonas sanxanigenens TaxID=397260 RepID=UPI001301840E|nr:hypothetical protein [Sphingomonas sanxanigenens]
MSFSLYDAVRQNPSNGYSPSDSPLDDAIPQAVRLGNAVDGKGGHADLLGSGSEMPPLTWQQANGRFRANAGSAAMGGEQFPP